MPASSQQSPTSGRRSAGLPHSRSRCARRRSTAGAAPPVRPSPLVARSRSSASRADHGHVAVVAEVEGQRQAPVALAADAPVAHVAQPVLHPLAVLRRRPLDAAGGLDHRLAHLVAADEPLVHQPVDQLGAAAPADGVAVGDLARLDQPPALAEVLDDLLRRVARCGGRAASRSPRRRRPTRRPARSSARPSRTPSSKSSAPQPGAMWTMPVPSSIETSSQRDDAVLDARPGRPARRTARRTSARRAPSP